MRIVEVRADRLRCDGDPDRLRQALDNVLGNALQFAPPRSEITVSVGVDGSCAHIGVTDEGPGFPEALLPVAFERFRRADSARTRGEPPGPAHIDTGTGLGLAIVQAVMRAHGGEATAANRSDGTPGAVLTMQWPATRNPADDRAGSQ
jgi:hypothetical protein